MSALRVASIIPGPQGLKNPSGYRRTELRRLCRQGGVDLLLFPEFFVSAKSMDAALRLAKRQSAHFDVPVVIGCTLELGVDDWVQLAVYHNARPRKGETRSQVWFKHSTVGVSAFALDLNPRSEIPLRLLQQRFSPAILGQWKIAAVICHDLFFPAIPLRLRQEGCNLLLNLAGGHVVPSKWAGLLRGYSVEFGIPCVCAMKKSRPNGPTTVSKSFAAAGGELIKPIALHTNKLGYGGFDVYQVGRRSLTVADCKKDDALRNKPSGKRYRKIRISLRAGHGETIAVTRRAGRLRLVVKPEGASHGPWQRFDRHDFTLWARMLTPKQLRDGALFLRGWPDVGETGPHAFVVFVKATRDLAPDAFRETRLLMELRAVQYRVAVVLIAGTQFEACKTSVHKRIQRFVGENGMIGLNLSCLGGESTTFSSGSWRGMDACHRDAYRTLVQG